jgi:hypothetical protein
VAFRVVVDNSRSNRRYKISIGARSPSYSLSQLGAAYVF